jgi:hypothetical protein
MMRSDGLMEPSKRRSDSRFAQNGEDCSRTAYQQCDGLEYKRKMGGVFVKRATTQIMRSLFF